MLIMKHRGPPKKKKKPIEPTTESSIVPVDPAPKKMIFPARYESVHLHSLFFCMITL